MKQYEVHPANAAQMQDILGWYARQGADGRWAYMAAAPSSQVTFRAAFSGRRPRAALGVCPAYAPCPQARAMAGQFGAHGVFLLPPAVFGSMYEPLAALLKHSAQDAGKGARVLAALPVKTGAAFLPAYFQAGFVLCAMRGLFELRAHYIFSYQPESQGAPDIWAPATDPLALSRMLAQGATGTALKDAPSLQIGLCKLFKSAQKTVSEV